MAVIDDEGRLFGIVNVIDLLVVLVVLAVVAAGVALLTGGDDARQGVSGNATNASNATNATRYATLAITSDRANLSARLDLNDTLRPIGGGSNLTVTDTYVGPAGDSTRMLVRVRYAGTLPKVSGSRVLIGQAIEFREEDLRAQGRLVAANETNASIGIDTTRVVVEARVNPSVVDEFQTGDELTIGGRQVAVIETVTTYPRAGSNESVVVGARLRTVTRGETPIYGTQPLRVGRQLRLRTDDAGLRGTIVARGRVHPPGEPVDTTVTVTLHDVSPTVADQFAPGMTEHHRGANATITAVDSEPASVTVTTADGEVIETTHPRNRDVTLTLNVTARRTSDELRFHGRPLRVGRPVTLAFGRVVVRGRIRGFQTN